ncbi:MAG TPA: hypothetical protein VGS19_23795, partial [Streptosporangiaceae bacterium]|nr:hypothetical protein [Streptosporangiaceae bacterium]
LGASLGDSLRASLGASLWASLGDSLRASLQIDWDFFNGQMEYWCAFYDAPRRLGIVTYKPADDTKLTLWCQLARSCGWWWPCEGMCVISERPSTVHVEPWDPARGTVRLHKAGGPAMEFRDGWKVWAWHGRQVSEWVVTGPTAKKIAEEANVEVRRCAIESLGWDTFIREAQLAAVAPPGADSFDVPDPGNQGQTLALYDVPERLWGSRVRLLMCTNGSVERDGTRRRYGLTVPAHVKTPVEAAAWTAGLTEHEYARMQRRT